MSVMGWFVVYHDGRKHSQLVWGITIMPTPLKMPTYTELVGLSDAELVTRIGLALSQYYKAEDLGENLTEKSKVYDVYKNELAKRNYKHHPH